MGLPALVHVELELGMAALRARPAASSSSGRSSPVSSVSTPRGSASSRSSTARATSSKDSPPATGSPSASPSHAPFRIADPVRLDVARGDRHRAGRDGLDRQLSSRRRSRRRSAPDRRRPSPRGRPASRGSGRRGPASTRSEPPARRASSTLRSFGSTTTSNAETASTAARSSAVEGFIVPAAVDDRGAEALEQPPVAAPARHGDRAQRPRARSGRHAAGAPRAPGVCSCMFAISTPPIVPRAPTERQRPPGIVGVDVNLQRRAVADDEQRVAERLELVLDRVGVEPRAFDDEDGAVAVARELLVEGLVGEARRRRLRRRLRAAAHP